uniref:Uncharacterized protein n=1 Tax=Mustela putorius furo TaxID=9669 RepID=M3XT78_MUSPF
MCPLSPGLSSSGGSSRTHSSRPGRTRLSPARQPAPPGVLRPPGLGRVHRPLPAAAGSFAPGRSSSSSSSSSCVVASVDRSSVSDACQEPRHLAQAFLLRLATCHSSSSSASADATRGRSMAAPGAPLPEPEKPEGRPSAALRRFKTRVDLGSRTSLKPRR